MPNEPEVIIDPNNEPVVVPVDINTIEDMDELRRIALENQGKAKRFEKDLRALKQNPQKPEAKIDESIVKDIEHLKLSEKKRQFGYQKGLSPEETDKLFQYAGDKDPDEVLKDSFFQAGLKEFRQAQKIENATPSSSNRTASIDGKSFKEMSVDDRKKNWNKIVGKA